MSHLDELDEFEAELELQLKREYTAVAVNRDITPRSTYTAVTLSEGDKVEIVRPMGGG